MKAKLVSINNPDGTLAYISLLPVTDAEFERLKPSGMALELDTQILQLSHGDPESVLRYQHLQQYEQMLEAAEKRIAELEAGYRDIVNTIKENPLEVSEDLNDCIGDISRIAQRYVKYT